LGLEIFGTWLNVVLPVILWIFNHIELVAYVKDVLHKLEAIAERL